MELKVDKVLAERVNKTVYKCGEQSVKVFSADYLKSDILNEALNQARAEETGLPVPKLLEAGKTKDGKWAIASEYISGVSLETLMRENPDKLKAYLERFVSLQMAVHAKTSPLMTKLKDKMNRKISASGLNASTRYELHNRVDAMPRHVKLCHGDFNPGNIIVGDDGRDYIIDWSHATQGNAGADAARTYLLFKLNGQDDIAEKYLTLFCKKSDTARQYVQKWMPIVAASQLVKGKPEERDFLLKWANVMDFE